MSDVKNILIVGVGGQGTLLSSKLIGKVLIDMGKDVKVSEVHGMSQRGGSVVTYVRYGKKVYSQIIEQGGADYILAFEELEAARFLQYLKPNGKIIVNTHNIKPITVLSGAEKYPEDIILKLKEKANVFEIDAFAMAKKSGSPKALNVVLIGVLAKELGIDTKLFEDAIKEVVPKKLFNVNIAAFRMGYDSMGEN